MSDTDAWGSELASWAPLIALLVVFGVVVAGLAIFGRGRPLQRIPDALERLTGIPGWAVAAGGTALYGLAIAGEGFYSDVAWHIALGRDQELFTAPHTSISVGLGMIFLSALVGIIAATAQQVPTRLRVGELRVPYSTLPLALLGGTALAGFPLDELWHEEYGVDVTMWSPTHMLMILGASLTGPAVWLVLAEAGVSPHDSRRARAAHLIVALLTLLGLSAPQGEFDFGVPQFQHIFHPVLITIVAAFTLVVIRLLHGPGWSVAVATASLLGMWALMADPEPIPTRGGARLYIVSALVVEAVAWLAGTDRRLRYGLLAGTGVATLGLAGEWVWNQDARQPWQTSLLPDAVLLALIAGVGTAVIAVAFAGALQRRPPTVGAGPVILAGSAVLVVLALPLPRTVGDVTASIQLETPDDEQTRVRVTLEPTGAATDARWFQTLSWQGGGLVVADMQETGPGEYVTDRAVPIHGRWKTLLRLHRGGELMAAPVYLPADPEIHEPEIPATDRRVELTGERQFLLREVTTGNPWLSRTISTLLALAALSWITVFTYTARRISHPPTGPQP